MAAGQVRRSGRGEPGAAACRCADARNKAVSYSDAVRKAAPAVVSIFTSKEVKRPRNPFMNDPLFRRFFGDRFEDEDAARLQPGLGRDHQLPAVIF